MVSADTLGDRIARAWRGLIGLAIVLLGTLGTLSVREYVQLTRATAEVERAQLASSAVDSLVSVLVDAETGYRGYLLTSDPVFLDPYRDVDTRSRTTFDTLASVLGGAVSGRRPQLTQLLSAVDAKLAEMSATLAQYQRGDKEGAVARVASGAGKRMMDEVRRIAASIKSDQQSVADERLQRADAAALAAQLLGASTVVIAVTLAGLAWSLNRNFERRRQELSAATVARLEAERDAAATASELQQSESFNRSILDNSGDCISVLLADGTIRYINRSGVKALQLSDDGRWLGSPWDRLWPGQEALVKNAVQRASDSNEGRFVAQRPVPGNAPQWWDVIITPVRSGSGAITQLVATARDVSDQKRAEEERSRLLASERAARSEAERTARLRDEFVATLSHELRTPLNAILGWVGVIKNDQTADTMSKAIDVIDRNTRRQSQMIDELLDMGRILSGKMRLDAQQVELVSLIEEAMMSAQPSADAKGIRLLSRLGPQVIVRGDPGRLQQVVWNLLSNAVKFTGRGGQVTVTLLQADGHVQVQVSDTGIGIPPELAPHVFERFKQADSSVTRRHGGLGIGLSIVKSLVELHGGSIEVASGGENTGSTFIVHLPLAPSTSRPDLATHAVEIDRATLATLLTGLRVLVVDDEEDTRDIAARLLCDAGAQVLAAASARDALQVIAAGPLPDVIVSDVGMPIQDGYEFIRTVRRMDGAAATIPAAALTALARFEDREMALSAGFQTHVAKPVDAAELVTAVANLVGRTTSTQSS